jgi:GGDEF domain-containing protein
LLPGLDLERTTALAEEARRAVEDLLINHSESPCGRVTVSIGVESLVPETYQTPPIWSRRPTARFMTPSGAAAIKSSRTPPSC